MVWGFGFGNRQAKPIAQSAAYLAYLHGICDGSIDLRFDATAPKRPGVYPVSLARDSKEDG